jgi:Xaa-Pro aminopeptidase
MGAPDYPRGIGIRGRPSADVTFEAGMALVIEINPVLGDQELGVFIGNTFVVEPGGVRRLHHTPVDLIVGGG